jgi:hypothetical protein
VPKAICALGPASQLPASASGTGKVRGDRASPTDTAANEVLMRDNTALFTTVYVFVVMEISTRRIVHCNVTESPALDWVKIQIRDIAAFDHKPRFLLHDNDGIFGQFGRRKDGFRCHLDRWLSTVMDIEGFPTPYHAPNANPHVERFHRTLRQDALNHLLPIRFAPL